MEHPVFIGGFFRFVGYLGCCLSQKKRVLSPDIVRFIRQEQLRRILPFVR
jgi:hypothetical protein